MISRLSLRIGRFMGLGLLLGLAPIAPSSPATGEARVYYLGLFMQTAFPINEHEIKRCHDLISVTRGITPEIIKALSVGDSSATEPAVHDLRLMIVRDGQPTIKLDRDGTVCGLGAPHGLNHESLKKLRRLIFSAFPEDWPER